MKKLFIMLTLVFIAVVGTQPSVEASETQKYGDVYYQIVPLPNGKKEVHIVGHASSSPHVVIPEKIKTYPVTEIAAGAFLTTYGDYWTENDASAEENEAYQASKIKRITLPNSLKRIGAQAFTGNMLTEINLPNSVIEVGDGAFTHNQLTKIKLSDYLVKIGDEAFLGNQLTKVIIPTKVKHIGKEAFAQNQLTSLTIPNSVTLLRGNIAKDNPIKSEKLPVHLQMKKDKKYEDLYYTFVKNSGKTEIKITGYNIKTTRTQLAVPASINKIPVTEIGAFAFAPQLTPSGTDRVDPAQLRLKSVTLPNSIRKIGTAAFEGTGILPAKFPTKLVEIGAHAFDNGTKNLRVTRRDITIPSKVKTIGIYAFAHNQLNGAVIVPKSVTALGEGAFTGNAFSKALINASIQEIPAHAFAHNNISNLTLPRDVVTIGDAAFEHNALLRLVLPTGVKVIGKQAFGSNQIQSVTLPSNIVTVSTYAFYNNKISQLKVPVSVRTFAFNAVENNPIQSVTFNGSKTTISKPVNLEVYTDSAKTKLFTKWNKIQPKSITLYMK